MHDWKNSWNCSLFRNEGAGLSSELIRRAVAATILSGGSPPSGGMITFVDPKKVKPKRTPGYCYVRALDCPGKQRKENFVFQLLPSDMPKPQKPLESQLSLLVVAYAVGVPLHWDGLSAAHGKRLHGLEP